jgi:hypothetical protein
MEWLRRLIDEVASPTWAAGVLETIVGAVIALAGALWIVRLQARHDRTLARETRLAASASAYGEKLMVAWHELWDLTDEARGRALRTGEDAPGQGTIFRAFNDTVPILGRVEGVYRLWWHRSWAWAAAYQALDARDPADLTKVVSVEFVEHHLTEALLDEVIGAAVMSVVNPNNWALRNAADALTAWDGRGSVPQPDLPKVITDLPLANEGDYRAWTNARIGDFNDYFDRCLLAKEQFIVALQQYERDGPTSD